MTEVLKSNVYLEHWALLVESPHIALQTKITYDELNHLNEMLHKFVAQVEDLYGLTAITYNTHQLLHIAECVKNWGPLWADSAFCGDKGELVMGGSRYASFGYLSALRRTGNAFCGYTGWPRVYNKLYNSIIQMTLRRVRITRLTSFLIPRLQWWNEDSKFYALSM